MNNTSANEETVEEKKTKKHYLYYFYFVIIFIVVGYTTIWFYLAAQIENNVSTALLENENGAIQLHCENLHKIGYPLRIGVGCEGVHLDLPGQDIQLTSPAFSSSAPIYAPHWLKFELVSPLAIETPSATLKGQWSSMTLETDIDQSSKMRLIIDNPGVRVQNSTVGIASDVSAKFLRVDLHDLGKDAELHLAFKRLDLPFMMPGEQTPIPPLDGNFDWTMQNAQPHFIFDGAFDPQAVASYLLGVKGSVDRARLTFASGGSLSVSGPFAINQQGYIDGKFTIALEDQSALLHTMRLLFPSQANNLQSIFFIIGSMPKDEAGNPTLSLSIDNGEVRLGFIHLGKINPIKR